ncbi:hypothetical protein KHP62_07360 [Rhodobacteraceae bacterium NNCM2]|nr:hypothetical protein [Coraliihabitans acroporae]
MPLDKIILYMIGGLALLGAVAYGAALVIGAVSLGPLGFLVLIPAFVVIYVVQRIIRERLANREDDYYDNIKR